MRSRPTTPTTPLAPRANADAAPPASVRNSTVADNAPPARRLSTQSGPDDAGDDALVNVTNAGVVAAACPASPWWWRAWRWWLPPALLSLVFALIFVDPFAGDWDALDYTVLALRMEPSSMLFGRMLFIFANGLAYKLAHAVFGLSAEHAYLLFKYLVVAETPLAVVACWVLVRDLAASRRTATVGALLLTLSPFFIIYSGQAMTEIPSLLLLAVALVVHLRGLRGGHAWQVLLGAALLGIGTNVREVAALYGLWLVVGAFACGWRPLSRRRDLLVTAAACAVFFFCALGPFALYYFGDIGNYRAAWHGWVESMRMEEGVHPVSPRNFVPLFFFFFVAAPLVLVALPVAAYQEWLRRHFSPLLALACVGFVANLSLITHYSTVINGRYLLTGLLGIVPLAADYFVRAETARTLERRRGFACAVAGVLLVGLLVGGAFYPFASPTIAGHSLTKNYCARLALLPPDAVVMAGGQTVSVTYYKGIGAGRWDVIGTGGGWPGARLPEVIDEYLRAGRRVFVDADARLWFTDSWRGEETRQLVALQDCFRFRRIADDLYELRPPDDLSALDDPNLRALLDKPASKIQRFKPS